MRALTVVVRTTAAVALLGGYLLAAGGPPASASHNTSQCKWNQPFIGQWVDYYVTTSFSGMELPRIEWGAGTWNDWGTIYA